jgi:toxin HigB-1
LISNFGNKLASVLFHRGSGKKLPRHLRKRAIHLLEVMEATDSLEDLKALGFPPSVRLHQLLGDRKGTWSLDIHKTSGWRITFKFEKGEFHEVTIEDYH